MTKIYHTFDTPSLTSNHIPPPSNHPSVNTRFAELYFSATPDPEKRLKSNDQHLNTIQFYTRNPSKINRHKKLYLNSFICCNHTYQSLKNNITIIFLVIFEKLKRLQQNCRSGKGAHFFPISRLYFVEVVGADFFIPGPEKQKNRAKLYKSKKVTSPKRNIKF